MKILITQRHTRNQQGEWLDTLESNYVRYFESFGMTLIPVSNAIANPGGALEETGSDGIVLTGGGDVNPRLYGGIEQSHLAVSEQRDRVESELLKSAIRLGSPVLAICRGMQFVNVFFGGQLIQEISRLDQGERHPCPGVHPVAVTESRLLAGLRGQGDWTTNSYHRQGVDRNHLGSGLQVFAMASMPELVEGLYHLSYPIAGIQWHPERPDSATVLDRLLLDSFLERRLFWEVRR